MENQKRDFFDVLANIIDKSIIVSEKAVEQAMPVATSYLEAFEKWLDSKLENTKVP
jgi:hypothetical protein